MENNNKFLIEPVSVNEYISLYDIRYKEGKHYYDASRRTDKNLVATMDDEAFKIMLPDAVTICIIIHLKDEEPKLLMFYEFRYPVGRYMLSTVAGLIDPEDAKKPNPLEIAAIREIKEETGINFKTTDRIKVINPCAFSSPGMTDESNAFLSADIFLDDLSELTHSGVVGSEMMKDFELLDVKSAKELYLSGRDKYGNQYSLATWVILAYFVMEQGDILNQ